MLANPLMGCKPANRAQRRCCTCHHCTWLFQLEALFDSRRRIVSRTYETFPYFSFPEYMLSCL